ncbi:hypothetical protein QE152_g26765 [Popillia japonica]|uniref:Uncharacterized protein n=1 Tax=Popillia japonica TaxID=7064 RepID=A0AAW1JXH6_POPJA
MRFHCGLDTLDSEEIILTSSKGCNRTYYGEVGKTYDLELHRPKEDKIPFICHLTFNAGGGDYGDLVQDANVSE